VITVAGFNTAIDRRIELDAPLVPGTVQRASDVHIEPGGKGLHVAQMAVELGEPARLLGLVDRVHAELIEAHLRARGVEWHGVDSGHPLRQCLAIHAADGGMTEILEPGAMLDVAARNALLGALDEVLDDSTVLVLSGSLPRGFALDTYATLVRKACTRGVPCLVDASGEVLRRAVDAGPWLVKPNADEAASLTGQQVDDVASAADCLHRLHQRGVSQAVVTLGAQGAVGFDGKRMWQAASDPARARNSVGSGDCFLAGLAVGAARGEPLNVSLARALACGAANAENAETGYASAAQVAAWMPRVHVQKLSESACKRHERGDAR
jgi:tagatose 6-phosphate kinase